MGKPSRYDGVKWADGHYYGIWRPAVKSTEDRIVSETKGKQRQGVDFSGRRIITPSQIELFSTNT